MHRNRRFRLRAVEAIVFAGFMLVQTSQASGQDPAIGQTPPASVEMFVPGLISTDLGERDASFHPNGEEFYFTLWTGRFGVIMLSRRNNGRWGRPETASFSGHHNDLEPFVTPDGSRLYFASTRPVHPEGEPADFNLWYVERVDDGWTRPEPVKDVNTEADEYYPSVDRAGTLYWTAAYEASLGGEDIWFAMAADSGFSARANAGPGVNTERDEFNATISPDGSWLAFGSFGREDGFGGGDLYISFKQPDGTFGPALNMGSGINSSHLDFCPALTPDGRGFLFSSRRTNLKPVSEEMRTYDSLSETLRRPGNGRSDIYWVRTGLIDELRQKAFK